MVVRRSRPSGDVAGEQPAFDFLTAPVQASQAAFDDSFNAWQQDINQFVARAGADSRISYRMSGVIF